jgi:TrmH family RNA methyltransferase
VVKRLRALQQRKERQSQQAFIAEGIMTVWRAVEQDVPIETLIVATDLLRSEPARAMVGRQVELGRRVVGVSAEIFKQTVERDHPSGLAAIIHMPRTSLADLQVPERALFAAFHSPSNPGNLGTSVRTLDATGGSGVILVGTGTDVFHPAAVRASMGALFSVPIVQVDSWETARTWFRANGIAIITTSSHADTDYWSVHLPLPSVVVFGNEGEGLPEEVLVDSDCAVRIPMAHGGSLNMAVAAAVALFEVRRQQAQGPPPLSIRP